MKCRHCGSTEFLIMKDNLHIGLYCENCLKWRKWIKKKEYSLYQKMYKELK